MILVDTEITKAVDKGDIVITPFDANNVNPNSYDVNLGNTLIVYGKRKNWIKRLYYDFISLFREVNPIELIESPSADKPIDCRAKTETVAIPIPLEGLVLLPKYGYLGSTIQRTENPKYVPVIYGKSSLGRNFLLVHFTAGFGDVGFNGHWTLELAVVHPLRIYAGMKIGQIVFFDAKGKVKTNYAEKADSKYKEQPNIPIASKISETK